MKWPTPLDSLRKDSQDRGIVCYNRTISDDFRTFSAFHFDVPRSRQGETRGKTGVCQKSDFFLLHFWHLETVPYHIGSLPNTNIFNFRRTKHLKSEIYKGLTAKIFTNMLLSQFRNSQTFVAKNPYEITVINSRWFHRMKIS